MFLVEFIKKILKTKRKKTEAGSLFFSFLIEETKIKYLIKKKKKNGLFSKKLEARKKYIYDIGFLKIRNLIFVIYFLYLRS